jgi:hypothetical protein
MALTFPTSPTNGQVFTDTITGNRYVYDSSKSIWKFSSNSVGMSVSSTPPANVAAGAMWFNREIGRTFVYYDDGDSVQWIETVPAGSIDTNTIAGYTNPIYASLNSSWTVTNTVYGVANAAFGLANTSFANTPNASFSSSFNVPNGSVSIGTNAFPVGKFQVVTANGEISRFTATGNSGGYVVSYFDNSTPWYLGSAKAAIAGNINDLYLGSGTGTNNNLLLGTGGTERMRITSAGNIAINTTNPVNTLTLAGSVTLLQNYQTYLVNSYYSGGWKYAYNGVAWGIGNNFGGVANGTTIAVASVNTSGNDAALTWIPAFNIDTVGRVTMPYQPYLKAVANGGGHASLVTGLTIPFNAVISQTGSNYNTSTYRFTAPVAGRYFVYAAIEASGTSTTYSNLTTAVNGAAGQSGTYKNMTSAAYQMMEVTDILNINAGDYISIIYLASGTSGSIEDVDSRCVFVVYLLG